MKNFRENLMHMVFFLCALTSIFAVVLICIFLFANGVPAMKEIGLLDFLTGAKWKPGNDIYGILPMILGSLYITAGAIVIGVPIGLLTAVFMAFYCPKKLYGLLKPCTELLAGIPSIVYGLFGMVVFVTRLHWGYSLLAGAMTLAIMILPLIMRTAEEALMAVPDSYREGSFGLGAGRLRTVFRIVLPAAGPGILSGVILGIGRIVGETAALIFTAGTMAQIPGLFQSGRTLAIHMYVLSGEALHMNEANATAVVLLLVVLLMNMLSALAAKKLTKK